MKKLVVILLMIMILPAVYAACQISVAAKNTNDLFNQISSVNSQFQSCPYQLPKAASVFVSGTTVVDVAMNNGQTQSLTVIISNGKVTGVQSGSGACKQRITISENDLNSILSSNDAKVVASLMANKRIKISGCTFLSKLKFFFANPIARFVAKRSTKPASNCGQIGEQCNNRGCLSGICAAPKEYVNGQWRFVNYRCIDQSEWAAKCEAKGNTPAPWDCITGPCS